MDPKIDPGIDKEAMTKGHQAPADPKIDKEVMRQWHKALAAEDCREVKRLLESDKQLLNDVWEANGQPWIRLSLRRAWKGRTALHVAARRGDVELVKQILSMAVEGKDEACSGSTALQTTLHRLLKLVDGSYDLDALTMAAVNGNRKIVYLLKNASLGCESNPYCISNDAEHAGDGENMAASSGNMPIQNCKTPDSPTLLLHQPSEIIRKVWGKLDQDTQNEIEQMYNADNDFNFLQMSDYLFHFTFSTWKSNIKQRAFIRRVRQQIFTEAFLEVKKVGKSLLFGLFDGQGRTPLHVSVDSNKMDTFLELVSSEDTAQDHTFVPDILNGKDSVGRTPLFRAVAKHQYWAAKQLLGDKRVDLNAGLECRVDLWGAGLDIDKLSMMNGFKSSCMFISKEKIEERGFNKKGNARGPHVEPLLEISSSPLHIAIIHRHESIVKIIVDKLLQNTPPSTVMCRRPVPWPLAPASKGDTSTFEDEASQDDTSTFEDPPTPFSAPYEVSTMRLAVLVGSIPILQHLLKAEEQKRGLFTRSQDEKDLPSFLLAAARGKPGTIKAFLNSQEGKFNAKKRDLSGNTALHHALKGRDVKVYPHLVDFVGCDHVFNWRWESDDRLSSWVANPHERKTSTRDAEKNANGELIKENQGQRQGSILLLLQAGVDILAKNDLLQTASPEPDAPQEFVKWWYEKEVQETQQMQKSLNDAANAISVTAALVATASFVGPLQPPLGYGGDPLGVQVEDFSVRIFIVCDTLSFYFALAAIMLGLLPNLPKPQQSAFKLLVRTRRLVAGAVACLFPSIICVLVAFGAGSIAVIRVGGFSQHYLTIVTTVVGGFFCLRVMKSFGVGLLRVLITLNSNKYRLDWRTLFMKALTELFLFGYELPIPTTLKGRLNNCDSKIKRKIA